MKARKPNPKSRTADRASEKDERATSQQNGGARITDRLHRAIGNQAIQTLQEQVGLQAKLEVSSPDDPAEREAEQVAKAVMRRDDVDGRRDATNTRSERAARDRGTRHTLDMCPRCVQRYRSGKPLDCTECKETLHRSVANPLNSVDERNEVRQETTETVWPAGATKNDAKRVDDAAVKVGDGGTRADVEGVGAAEHPIDGTKRSDGPGQAIPDRRSGSPVGQEIESTVQNGVRSGGKPLPSDLRSNFEAKMGADFSVVQVHTGTAADEAATSINAKAFTIGSDIAFADGNYDPHTSSGRELIAHELTHVMQQRGSIGNSRVARRDNQDDETIEAEWYDWGEKAYASNQDMDAVYIDPIGVGAVIDLGLQEYSFYGPTLDGFDELSSESEVIERLDYRTLLVHHFDIGSADVDERGSSNLSRLLTDTPFTVREDDVGSCYSGVVRALATFGFTDSIGSDEENEQLRFERAIGVQGVIQGHDTSDLSLGEVTHSVLGCLEAHPAAMGTYLFENAPEVEDDDREKAMRNRGLNRSVLVYDAIHLYVDHGQKPDSVNDFIRMAIEVLKEKDGNQAKGYVEILEGTLGSGVDTRHWTREDVRETMENMVGEDNIQNIIHHTTSVRETITNELDTENHTEYHIINRLNSLMQGHLPLGISEAEQLPSRHPLSLTGRNRPENKYACPAPNSAAGHSCGEWLDYMYATMYARPYDRKEPAWGGLLYETVQINPPVRRTIYDVVHEYDMMYNRVEFDADSWCG